MARAHATRVNPGPRAWAVAGAGGIPPNSAPEDGPGELLLLLPPVTRQGGGRPAGRVRFAGHRVLGRALATSIRDASCSATALAKRSSRLGAASHHLPTKSGDKVDEPAGGFARHQMPRGDSREAQSYRRGDPKSGPHAAVPSQGPEERGSHTDLSPERSLHAGAHGRGAGSATS